MADLTLHDQIYKENLYSIGYKYLCDNFHKLSTANKIRVSISVLQIFNKDGSKTDDGKRLIYVVNGDRKFKRPGTEVEISSSPITADNSKLIE